MRRLLDFEVTETEAKIQADENLMSKIVKNKPLLWIKLLADYRAQSCSKSSNFEKEKSM